MFKLHLATFSGLFNVFCCKTFQVLLISSSPYFLHHTHTHLYFLFAIINHPAPVEILYENMHFLITHNPNNVTLNKFTKEFKKYKVTTLVQVCDVTYAKAPVVKEGIHVLDWPLDDGAPPPNQIVDEWLNLLNKTF